MEGYLPTIDNGTEEKIKSGILLKDFNEKRFNLKQGTYLKVEVVNSDIVYSVRYKKYLTVGIDIELV